MSETMSNTRPERRQLSAELDRFSSILDGLSDALNAAVADASREGVRLAVKEAVVELLTSAELRTALHQASAPDDEPSPSFISRLNQTMRRTVSHVKEAVASAASAVATRVGGAARAAARVVNRARHSTHFRAAVRLLVGVGAAVAVVRCVATRGFGAAIFGLWAMLTVAAHRVRGWGREVCGVALA